jgi:hypothetical protein
MERQVSTLMRRGQLPWIDMSRSPSQSSRSKRISEHDLMAFVEARRVSPPAPRIGRRRRIA